MKTSEQCKLIRKAFEKKKTRTNEDLANILYGKLENPSERIANCRRIGVSQAISRARKSLGLNITYKAKTKKYIYEKDCHENTPNTNQRTMQEEQL